MKTLTGVVTPLSTPVNEWERLCQVLIDGGVNGPCPNGTTGEAVCRTLEGLDYTRPEHGPDIERRWEAHGIC